MKVLVVMHNLKREGAQLVAYALAVGLRKCDGIDVDVAAVDSSGVLGSELAAEGVSVGPYDAKAASGYDVILVNTIMLHETVKELVEEVVPVVWLLHESNMDVLYETLPGLRENLESLRIHEKCARVMHVCQSSINEFQTALTSSNLGYIHNGVDVGFIQGFANEKADVREKLGIGKGEVVVVTAGTPKERKGQLGVAEACWKVGARCLVVGASNGDIEKCTDYEKAIHAAGGTLIERGPASRVYRIMAAADIYVCNSSIESFPLSILEAMSLSLPIVSTNINGIPEQVTHGTEGLLYPPTDLPALTSALRQFFESEATRTSFGQAACARAEKYFSLETMVNRWQQLLTDVCASKDASL